MSSSSNETSSPCKRKMDGAVVGSRLIECVCNYQLKKIINRQL
jgi:hypothetical protein